MTLAPERDPLEFESIDDVPAALRATDAPGLERPSVYRDLERLQLLGAVTHIHARHGPGRWVRSRRRPREAFGLEARFTRFPIHERCAGCA
jgi:Fe2+ or Zn2+ uptake regulation protein